MGNFRRSTVSRDPNRSEILAKQGVKYVGGNYTYNVSAYYIPSNFVKPYLNQVMSLIEQYMHTNIP